jgi:hypothetical protein
VQRVFSLDEPSLATEYEERKSSDDGKVSETTDVQKNEKTHMRLQPISLEEIRREARENWLRSRRLKVEGAINIDDSKVKDREVKHDQGHTLGGDIDE